jgi:hypothetical protein
MPNFLLSKNCKMKFLLFFDKMLTFLYIYSFSLLFLLLFIQRTGLFFDFVERLYLRIPAAVGLLCVGFWRRVGVSTVFSEVFFFIFFYFFLFFLSLSLMSKRLLSILWAFFSNFFLHTLYI